MNQKERLYNQKSQERLSRAYETEKPKLITKVRAAGKTVEAPVFVNFATSILDLSIVIASCIAISLIVFLKLIIDNF